ncbi:MAG: hypothetical protein V3S48_06435 [Candidatus Neomarinimicrobiota bacterium]
MKNYKYQIVFICLVMMATNVQSQFYFGRNKIQYQQFDWQILATEHFDIYYYEQELEIARAAAIFAEEAYDEYKIRFDFELQKKIPLVIYANHVHFQQTNVIPNHIPAGVGGFFEFIKGRVVLPYTGRMWDFYHVVRHELVHVFMNHKIRHQMKKAKKWDRPHLPLWFSEGLAEWWSIGWDSQAEIVLRDAVLFDNLQPLHRAAGFLVYKEGQAFFRYLEKNYSGSIILQILDSYWLYDSFQEALADLTGEKYGTLMEKWEQSLKKEFAKSLQAEDAPPADKTILTRGRINTAPASYRDESGKLHVVFLSNRYGFVNIYDNELGLETAFPAIKGERSANLESLHLMQSELSVNGANQVVFSTRRRGRDALVVSDLRNGAELKTLWNPDISTIRSPAWSASGSKIVFSGSQINGINDLWLWEPALNSAVPLTRDIYADWDPVFSQDEKWILFSSDRGNKELSAAMNLFLLEIESGKIHSLTNDNFENLKPEWNPHNAGEIIFISTRSGVKNIWKLKFLPGDNTMVMTQVSNLHTGVIEISPVETDTVLATLFKEYSFGIHILALEPKAPVITDLFSNENVSRPWKLPALTAISGETESIPYHLKYGFDLAQTAVAYDPYFGILGGGQFSVSDILGNRYYHFLVTNSSRTPQDFLSRFSLAITSVYLKNRYNRAWGIFYFSNDYFDPYQAFYFERSIGIRGGLSIPLDVFQRFEYNLSLWHSSREFVDKENISSMLISNTISWVHDNSIWSPLGPMDGWRARLTAAPIFDLSRGLIYNYTFASDIRVYYQIRPRITFAQRVNYFINDGIDKRRHYIGGSWTLRLYPYNGIYGRKYLLINNELRFPFARALHLDLESVSFGMGPWQGAVFIDAGNAWEDAFPGFIGSFGFGLRAWFGGTVLRWDFGKRTNFTSISENWYSEIFFGWDF